MERGVTKKQLRTNLLRAHIIEVTGRNDRIPDDVLHAALEFNGTYVSWKTITRVLSLLEPFLESRQEKDCGRRLRCRITSCSKPLLPVSRQAEPSFCSRMN